MSQLRCWRASLKSGSCAALVLFARHPDQHAEAINEEIRHGRAQPFEKMTRVEDRRMLDLGGDDVGAWSALREEDALQGRGYWIRCRRW